VAEAVAVEVGVRLGVDVLVGDGGVSAVIVKIVGVGRDGATTGPQATRNKPSKAIPITGINLWFMGSFLQG